MSFYYGDTKSGTPTIQAGSTGLLAATEGVTITAGAPSQVAITPNPSSASASNTTNITLRLQLQDQFSNSTVAGAAGGSNTVTLSLSSNSTKEFFSGTLGGTGTLNSPVNVTFANGVGTATEYYGDETASASTTITALNGATVLGHRHVTITAKTTGDT